MNKYEEALDGIIDLAIAYDFEEIPGSNYPRYYFDGDTFKSEKKRDEDIELLQKAIDKAKAFDRLIEVRFIELLDKPNKTIMIRNGINEVVCNISNEDYEILEKAMR